MCVKTIYVLFRLLLFAKLALLYCCLTSSIVVWVSISLQLICSHVNSDWTNASVCCVCDLPLIFYHTLPLPLFCLIVFVIRRLFLVINLYCFCLLKVLSTCFICLEDDSNLSETECCRKKCHKKCLKKWKRTLVESAGSCPHCRTEFGGPVLFSKEAATPKLHDTSQKRK